MNEEFSDRMKVYEGMEAGRRFMPLLPVCARLDGKNFSSYTSDMRRPYDERLSWLMVEVTKALVRETCACVGYTQSDEISLVWHSDDVKSQIFFDGRIMKIVSVLASMCSWQFYIGARELWSHKRDIPTIFDCRAWTVPSKVEAANEILWREQDASKNSVSSATRTVCSHKEMQGKSCSEMQDILHANGINWNDYPPHFKRGTFVQRRKVTRRFTPEEIEAMPERHEARSNPDLVIERHDVVELPMPPFSKVTNRVGVIFDGEDPVVEEQA
jgi:tRNA(His) 5'-end guanylyltransferase